MTIPIVMAVSVDPVGLGVVKSLARPGGNITGQAILSPELGANAMDWSTNLGVRARKEPPDKGGWNVLHTWWLAADVISPAVHFGVSGAGPGAWYGWPDIPQLDNLVTNWVRAIDQTKRKQLADDIQKIALDEVAYVPWGEWVDPTAFRKNVQGILKFAAPVFWNVVIKYSRDEQWRPHRR